MAKTPTTTSVSGPLVVRSEVPAGLQYHQYKEELRYDFFYSCGYCTISEVEARAIRFVIDHYEPRKARPDLEHAYANLIYACDPCNTYKGDRCPPESARAAGYRFFRPDADVHGDHFECKEIVLYAKSNVGNYSIEALELNRLYLRKIRALRSRLANCAALVAEGVSGLRRFQLDQLPPNVRGLALRAIRRAEATAKKMADDIDEALRQYARSELIDPDPEAKVRAAERLEKLAKTEALFPGSWRAPRKPRKKTAK